MPTPPDMVEGLAILIFSLDLDRRSRKTNHIFYLLKRSHHFPCLMMVFQENNLIIEEPVQFRDRDPSEPEDSCM